MCVDLEVALGFDRQPEATVPPKLIQHVVEERDAGSYLHRSPIE
jgi:hypothetical protein